MSEMEIKFMKTQEDDGAKNLADDPRFCTMALCVLSQQDAGLKTKGGTPVIDLREAECPDCQSPGYNTGWGHWRFTCGAEILSDGEPSEPCARVAGEGEDSTKENVLAAQLRQIADELDAEAVQAPCSEAQIIREAARTLDEQYARAALNPKEPT